MNVDNVNCMGCGQLITDTDAPDRFCSQACFDTLLAKVKADWDQRYREARANGNGRGNGVEIKPLSEIMKALNKPAAPKPPLLRRRAW
jgi:hypothetical protein